MRQSGLERWNADTTFQNARDQAERAGSRVPRVEGHPKVDSRAKLLGALAGFVPEGHRPGA
eukprot:3528879-Rhodomonas_salina.1